MDKISCIYIIKSKSKPDRCYVGSAINLAARKRQHLSDLRLQKHVNIRLQSHINKYGIDDLYFDVLEIVSDKSRLIEKEQHFIDTIKPSFNILKKAGSVLGYRMTKELREANRQKALGNHYALGHKKSDEFRKSHSDFMKGKKFNLGKKWSAESKKRQSERMKGVIVYIPTEAHKKAARERLLGDKTNLARKVVDVNNGKVYGCIKDAARDINIKYGKLRNMLCGQIKNTTTIKYYSDASR
jgi:group I intron endonuclease